MGFLTRALQGVVNASYSAFQRKDALQDLLSLFSFTFPSKAGQTVNVDTALQVGACFACCRVLAEGIAQMPLKVYRENSDGGTKDLAAETPIYQLLYRRPNEWQTSFEFRETLMYHAVLTGNAFAFINRDGKGRIQELLPLLPTRVRLRQDAQFRNWYDITDADGTFITLPRKAIFHLRGPSWNAIHGLDVIRLAREEIGLSMALEEGQAKLHKNGVNPGGIISVTGQLSQPAKENLRAKIQEMHAGDMNAGNLMILDQAATFSRIMMTAQDAQTIQSRQHQVEEICRCFRVFPQLIGHTEKTMSYASSEQFFLAHVVHSMAPWAERWEQTIHRDLLDDPTLYAKLNFQGLLRGDSKSRAEFYASGITNGWLTRNEAREKEDYNPLKGLDIPLMPLNMADGSKPPAPPAKPPANGGGTPGKQPSSSTDGAQGPAAKELRDRILLALDAGDVHDATEGLKALLTTLGDAPL